jgi:hypothetical protein
MLHTLATSQPAAPDPGQDKEERDRCAVRYFDLVGAKRLPVVHPRHRDKRTHPRNVTLPHPSMPEDQMMIPTGTTTPQRYEIIRIQLKLRGLTHRHNMMHVQKPMRTANLTNGFQLEMTTT